MRGVGEQREGTGDQADDDLDGHEAGDQSQSETEPTAIGVGGHSMRVAFMVIGAVLMTMVVCAHGVLSPVRSMNGRETHQYAVPQRLHR